MFMGTLSLLKELSMLQELEATSSSMKEVSSQVRLECIYYIYIQISNRHLMGSLLFTFRQYGEQKERRFEPIISENESASRQSCLHSESRNSQKLLARQ